MMVSRRLLAPWSRGRRGRARQRTRRAHERNPNRSASHVEREGGENKDRAGGRESNESRGVRRERTILLGRSVSVSRRCHAVRSDAPQVPPVDEDDRTEPFRLQGCPTRACDAGIDADDFRLHGANTSHGHQLDGSEGLSEVAQTQLRARRPTSVHRTRPSIVGKDPRRSGRQGLAPARAASLRSEQVPNRRRGDTNGKEPARRTPCRATWTRKPRRSTSMGNSCCSIRCAPSTRSRRRLERPTRLARSPPSVGSRLVFLGHIPLTRHISPSLPDLQELDAKVRRLRDEVKDTKKTFDKTEDDLKALQSMGQIIGEVLRQLDDEKCASSPEIQAPPAPFKREPDSLRNSAPPSLFSPTPR